MQLVLVSGPIFALTRDLVNYSWNLKPTLIRLTKYFHKQAILPLPLESKYQFPEIANF